MEDATNGLLEANTEKVEGLEVVYYYGEYVVMVLLNYSLNALQKKGGEGEGGGRGFKGGLAGDVTAQAPACLARPGLGLKYCNGALTLILCVSDVCVCVYECVN